MQENQSAFYNNTYGSKKDIDSRCSKAWFFDIFCLLDDINKTPSSNS